MCPVPTVDHSRRLPSGRAATRATTCATRLRSGHGRIGAPAALDGTIGTRGGFHGHFVEARARQRVAAAQMYGAVLTAVGGGRQRLLHTWTRSRSGQGISRPQLRTLLPSAMASGRLPYSKQLLAMRWGRLERTASWSLIWTRAPSCGEDGTTTQVDGEVWLYLVLAM